MWCHAQKSYLVFRTNVVYGKNAFWAILRFLAAVTRLAAVPPCWKSSILLDNRILDIATSLTTSIAEVSELLWCVNCLRLKLVSVCRPSPSRFCRLCWSLKMVHTTPTMVRLTLFVCSLCALTETIWKSAERLRPSFPSMLASRTWTQF